MHVRAIWIVAALLSLFAVGARADEYDDTVSRESPSAPPR
jgi:hypothetical protein